MKQTNVLRKARKADSTPVRFPALEKQCAALMREIDDAEGQALCERTFQA